MPKPDVDEAVKRNFKCAFYRWEFIRRSDLYVRDFNEFFSEFGDWLESQNFDMTQVSKADVRYWNEIERRLLEDQDAKKYYQERIVRYQACLMLKWGVIQPLHPSYSYDPNDLISSVMRGIPANLPGDESIDLSIPLKVLAKTAVEAYRKKIGERLRKLKKMGGDPVPYEISVYIPERLGTPGKHDLFSINDEQWKQFKKQFSEFSVLFRQLGLTSLLKLEPEAEEFIFQRINALIGFLDINRQIVIWPIIPQLGKGANMKEFHRILKAVKFHGFDSGFDPLKQQLPNSKLQIKKLGEYLAVWDLRVAAPGLTNLEIAQRLFGDTYHKDADPEAPTRRVLRAFSQAEKYIRGNFRQIR